MSRAGSLLPCDGDLGYRPGFLPAAEADRLLQLLLDGLEWQRWQVRIAGRQVDSPRLSAWYGDADAAYGYSGIRLAPRQMPAPLVALRARLRAALGADFNGVLANLYRDGADSMGWHSDDERELGAEPLIASLSFGAPRRFLLRHRRRRELATLRLELEHGSLLVMGGATQRCWRHSLPKTRRLVGARVNLTFRRVGAAQST